MFFRKKSDTTELKGAIDKCLTVLKLSIILYSDIICETNDNLAGSEIYVKQRLYALWLSFYLWRLVSIKDKKAGKILHGYLMDKFFERLNIDEYYKSGRSSSMFNDEHYKSDIIAYFFDIDKILTHCNKKGVFGFDAYGVAAYKLLENVKVDDEDDLTKVSYLTALMSKFLSETGAHINAEILNIDGVKP